MVVTWGGAPGRSISLKVVATTLNIPAVVSTAFAEALGGDIETLTTEDVLMLRSADLNDAIFRDGCEE